MWWIEGCGVRDPLLFVILDSSWNADGTGVCGWLRVLGFSGSGCSGGVAQ